MPASQTQFSKGPEGKYSNLVHVGGLSAVMIGVARFDVREDSKVRNPRPLPDTAELAEDEILDVYGAPVVAWSVLKL